VAQPVSCSLASATPGAPTARNGHTPAAAALFPPPGRVDYKEVCIGILKIYDSLNAK
jgi:hypothetical protein